MENNDTQICCKGWRNQNVGWSNDAKITIHKFHKFIWVSSGIGPRFPREFLDSTWPSVIPTKNIVSPLQCSYALTNILLHLMILNARYWNAGCMSTCYANHYMPRYLSFNPRFNRHAKMKFCYEPLIHITSYLEMLQYILYWKIYETIIKLNFLFSSV